MPKTSIVFPYANNFSVRDGALEASKHAIRVLGYELNVPVQAYGEYHLDKLPQAGLIVLPCARSLSCQAWEILMDRVGKGATLLMTGPFSYDAYFRRVEGRSAALGIRTKLCPIAREETLYIQGTPYRASFPGNKYEWVDAERIAGASRDELTQFTVGRGQVLYSPLPIELSAQDEGMAAAYRKALDAAHIAPDFAVVEGRRVGVLIKKLAMAEGNLWVLVCERAQDAAIALQDAATGKTYRLTVPGNRAMLFATDLAGAVIAAYRDREIAF